MDLEVRNTLYIATPLLLKVRGCSRRAGKGGGSRIMAAAGRLDLVKGRDAGPEDNEIYLNCEPLGAF